MGEGGEVMVGSGGRDDGVGGDTCIDFDLIDLVT